MAVKVSQSNPSFWDTLGNAWNDSVNKWGYGAKQIGQGLDAADKFLFGGTTGTLQKAASQGLQSIPAHAPQQQQAQADPFGVGPTYLRAMQQGRDHQQYQAEQAAKNQPAPPLSLQDYLNQALGMLSQFGGGDQSARIGGAYDNQIAATQAQGAQGDQVLQQAYANLVAQYANDLPGIQQNYDSAASTIQGNNAAANQDINAGYGASNAAQSDILKNLGIGDAQGVIAQNNFGGNDQAHALANVAQGGASSLNANAENKATASTYNSEAGAAQGVAGAAQRALLQQNLAQTLAQMQSQKASAVAGSQSNNSAQALQLAQYLQQQGEANDPNSLANQQAYAKLLAQQQQDQASNTLKQQAITAPLYGTLAKQGQNNTDIIATLKALGLV